MLFACICSACSLPANNYNLCVNIKSISLINTTAGLSGKKNQFQRNLYGLLEHFMDFALSAANAKTCKR